MTFSSFQQVQTKSVSLSHTMQVAQKLKEAEITEQDSLHLEVAQKLKEAEITEQDSLLLTRNLLRIVIFNVSCVRGLYSEKYFSDKSVPALDMKIKKLRPMDAESRRLIDWMEKGVYDALQKKYLRALMFSVSEAVEGPMFSVDLPKRTIMSRPGSGTAGRDIPLKTNHMNASVKSLDVAIYQYSVSISSEDKRVKENNGFGRKILDKLYQTYCSELSGKIFVYDGEKSMYTVGPLPQNNLEFIVVLEESIAKCEPGKSSRHTLQSKLFKVNITYSAKIPLRSLSLALHGAEPERLQYALRVLDIILTQEAANRGCLLVRQSFLRDDSRSFTDIGVGVRGCHGFHSSFHPTQGGLSLNMDLSTTMILAPGLMIDFLKVNQNAWDPRSIDWMNSSRLKDEAYEVPSDSTSGQKLTGEKGVLNRDARKAGKKKIIEPFIRPGKTTSADRLDNELMETNIINIVKNNRGSRFLISKTLEWSVFEVFRVDEATHQSERIHEIHYNCADLSGYVILASDYDAWLLLFSEREQKCCYVNLKTEQFVSLPELPCQPGGFLVGDFNTGREPLTTVLMWPEEGRSFRMLVKTREGDWVERVTIIEELGNNMICSLCKDLERVIGVSESRSIFAVNLDGTVAWDPKPIVENCKDGCQLVTDSLGRFYQIGYREEFGRWTSYRRINSNGEVAGSESDSNLLLEPTLFGKEVLLVGNRGYSFPSRNRRLQFYTASSRLGSLECTVSGIMRDKATVEIGLKTCNSQRDGMCQCSHAWLRS